ncbi:MAG TPA: ATP phosphoribosyltransferase regulatory subunit [Alphaproteobacteria bacterium]|nr:ATP phosphoribosyltransferase regulatory subunit [Alphaproteobacteria bacterium]
MTELARRALLPAGLRDVLPPEADQEAEVVHRLMAVCAQHGYARVKPPLVEFEDSLLAGSGAAMGPSTFRLMDPVSQRMLGLRADMTLQIARIAATRLRRLARPLRLSYAGQVLRVKGDDLRPERQIGQVGAELIGSEAPAADAEAILLAATALEAIGVPNLTVDLSSPRLVPAVIATADLDEAASRRLRDALDRKDQAAVKKLGRSIGPVLMELMKATGPAARAEQALAKLDLPADAAAEALRLSEIVGLLRFARPDLNLTIDPVERRGFEYHTGVCFTLFARRVRGELGRGGRYLAGESLMAGRGEPATGFTLFLDTILRAVPEPQPQKRLFLPFGTSPAEGRKWRDAGWTTVAGLDASATGAEEASRLDCSHWLDRGTPHAVK